MRHKRVSDAGPQAGHHIENSRRQSGFQNAQSHQQPGQRSLFAGLNTIVFPAAMPGPKYSDGITVGKFPV